MNHSFAHVDVGAMLRIAGEVAELAADVQLRRAHILDGLLALVGGCSAVCSEIDPRHAHGSGWAVPNSITCAGGLSASQHALIDRYVTGHIAAALDPCIPLLLREEKPVATVRRGDVVDDSSWFRSAHFNEVRRPLGFGESLYAKFTAPDGACLKLSVHRETGDRPFTTRHAQLLHIFNENLASLYIVAPHDEAPSNGSPRPENSMAALPPRLRPVLRRLLAGDAEKQAAATLGLSPHTVHQYTKTLYRAFGVNSRGELLAKFVVSE
jgi:DNA-binding CsgD family transcriptional regulator